MTRTLAAVTDFCRAAEARGAREVLIVATSAVREASNAENFLNRIYMATRLEVEVIATSEESRLTVSAVRSAVSAKPLRPPWVETK
ncbi:MAG: hypothetical protein ACK44M_03640 [Chloroflexus sp.]